MVMDHKVLKKYLEGSEALLTIDPARIMKWENGVPNYWGKDPLTDVLKNATISLYATFHNFGRLFRKYNEIYNTFEEISKSLKANDNNIFHIFMFQRTCSAFIASVRLASSGQVPETHVMLRSCLEYSLYAFHMRENPDSQYVWAERHKDEKGKKKCSSEFAIRSILKVLKEEDDVVGGLATKFYENCIDYGAHPNEKGVFQTVTQNEEGFQLAVLDTGESLAMKLAVIQTARLALCCLYIFQYVFPEKYKELNITQKLVKLRENL